MFKTKGIAFALVIAVILVLSGCNAEPVTTTITKTDTITTTKTVNVTETITQTSNITSTVTTTLIPATTTTSKTSTTTDTTVATTDTTTATTTQSQEIFSEDGKVKTLKHWMEAHITSISVFAVVKNVSDAPVNVLYKVDFLDAYGNLIGTLEKYAEDLQPGKSKQLELVYEGNYSQNVMCYFIYLSAE